MNIELKQKILDEIRSKVSVFRKVSSIQYVIRCPFCGDSKKDPNDAHLYLKCSNDPLEGIWWKCFLCSKGSKGIKQLVDKLGIVMKEDLGSERFNRISQMKTSPIEIMTGKPKMDSDQVGYIEYRIGEGLTEEDYDKFKIVWNMYNIGKNVSEKVRNTLPSNRDSISFLSADRSMLLTRTFADNHPTWMKRKLFPSENREFYTVASTLNLLSNEPVVVNVGEGVFDILSVYKHFNTGENSLHLAILGKDYKSAVDYIVNLGLVGSNIDLRIYIDSNIDVGYMKKVFKDFKWIFGKITLFRNSKKEDFGHPIDKIQRVEIPL